MRRAALALLILATPATGQGLGPLVFEGSGQTRTIDCTGRDVVVRGERNALTFTGGCRSLAVEGNANQIRAALAPGARVALRGELLDLAWSQVAEGEAPRFATDGRQIRVERSGSPILAERRAAERRQTDRGLTLTLSGDVLFPSGSDRLQPAAAEGLAEVAELIRQVRPRAVTIIGHSDSVGEDVLNRELSLRRARSVQRWLEERAGGAMPAVVVDGRGEADPIASNDTAEGRAQNRRVEIVLER